MRRTSMPRAKTRRTNRTTSSPEFCSELKACTPRSSRTTRRAWRSSLGTLKTLSVSPVASRPEHRLLRASLSIPFSLSLFPCTEARPYPRRNLLPNFLTQAATARNPFLTTHPANPAGASSKLARAQSQSQPRWPDVDNAVAGPSNTQYSPANSAQLDPHLHDSYSHSDSPHPAAASPAIGTKQLLLSRDDPCVCGVAIGRMEGVGWEEHIREVEDGEDGCEMLRGMRGRGWRVFREV